jgi:hypothetical protein
MQEAEGMLEEAYFLGACHNASDPEPLRPFLIDFLHSV